MFEVHDGLIPKERYISREFLELERERLWPHVWQMACREEEVPSVGSFLEYEITDQSILIVRSSPDRIQAFYNSCLHRGTKICVAQGTADELRCPFHGWCWNLDGTNREILDPHEFPGLDRQNLPLRECQVGRWGGFVFVNMDADAAPLEDFLGPLPGQLSPYHLEEMTYQSYRTTIVPCNWKTALDAFIEAYHVAQTHPQGLPMIDDVNTRYENFDIHSRMINPLGKPSPRLANPPSETEILRGFIEGQLDVQLASEEEARMFEQMKSYTVPEGRTARDVFVRMRRDLAQARGLDFSGLSDDQMMDDWDYTVFPNVVFNTLPGEVFGFRWRPNGSDPDSCIFDVISLHLLPANAEHLKVEHRFVDYRWENWGIALMQDMANLPRIQAGMHSSGFQGLRLAANQERRIVQQHQVLDRYLGIGGEAR